MVDFQILQKKERISEISKDRPEYHMSEERLKEMEKQKQNRLNNVYNDLFPNLKPAVVTLPKVTVRSKSPEYPEPEPVQSINTAEWDVAYKEPKKFTAEEVNIFMLILYIYNIFLKKCRMLHKVTAYHYCIFKIYHSHTSHICRHKKLSMHMPAKIQKLDRKNSKTFSEV